MRPQCHSLPSSSCIPLLRQCHPLQLRLQPWPMRDDVMTISTAMDSSHEARTDGDCGDGWEGRLIVSRPGTVEALYYADCDIHV